MQWTLLGAGALGCVIAGLLRQQDESVALMLSERHRGHFHPLYELINLNGRSELINTQACFAEQARAVECLLVVTKAYQVVPALSALTGLSAHTPIILLHNGLGVAEQVATLFPDNPLLAGICSHGAMKEADWKIRHTGKGETWLGGVNEAGKKWAHLVEPLARALGHAQWSDHIEIQQRRKLAINAVINPLTAYHNIANGELLTPRFDDVLTQLSEEVHQVIAQLDGPDAESLPAFRRRLQQVLELTATNYSSMQQDVAHGRPTENNYISGYVVAHAGQIPIPVTLQLYQAIQRLERE